MSEADGKGPTMVTKK
jgi:hypothetical protein